MSRLQPNEQMNVVFDSADALRKTAECFRGSAKVFMKPRFPCGVDDSSTMFGAERNVIMET